MKIICVGRNYAAHAKELKSELPSEPVIFLKPETSRLRGKKVFFLPSFSKEIHHELELVLKINHDGKNIHEKFAYKYYDELTVGIDFTARDLQNSLKSKGLPWELSKSFDSSAPVGKFIPKSEIMKKNILFHLDINGKTVQSGNSADMIFSFDRIISFVSTYITLRQGDLIFTGTPEGVGPVKRGDLMVAGIGDEILLELQVA